MTLHHVDPDGKNVESPCILPLLRGRSGRLPLEPDAVSKNLVAEDLAVLERLSAAPEVGPIGLRLTQP